MWLSFESTSTQIIGLWLDIMCAWKFVIVYKFVTEIPHKTNKSLRLYLMKVMT